jgi:hypothetical protein
VTPPPGYSDYEDLFTLARHLLAQRVARDPAQVEAGKMTAEVAATRLRVMTAICAVWNAVTRGEDIPPLDATPLEMASDLGAIAQTLAARAEKSDDVQTQSMSKYATALLWQHQPKEGFTKPHIILMHELTLDMRQRRAAERMAA